MLCINVLGTFIVNAHVADAINRPLNHPDGTDKHAPFWTTNEERGVIVNFASAAANPYARVLSYGPTKTAVVGITKCKPSLQAKVSAYIDKKQHSLTSWVRAVSE